MKLYNAGNYITDLNSNIVPRVGDVIEVFATTDPTSPSTSYTITSISYQFANGGTALGVRRGDVWTDNIILNS